MPINWNEVDRLKLEYIQQQEAAKVKYEEELKAYKEELKKKGFFGILFSDLKEPIDIPFMNSLRHHICYCSKFIFINANIDDIFIVDLYNHLPSEYADQIFKYLGLNKNDKDPFYNAYRLDDTEENRKKIDKVVALIEKYTSEKQKEAEAYIDNFINNKEGK